MSDKNIKQHQHLTSMSWVLASISLLALSAQACLGGNHKPVIKSILDVTEVACVLVDDHTDDESVLAKACNIADEYIPDVRVLVQAKKQAAARKAALAHGDASADGVVDTSVTDSKKD